MDYWSGLNFEVARTLPEIDPSVSRKVALQHAIESKNTPVAIQILINQPGLLRNSAKITEWLFSNFDSTMANALDAAGVNINALSGWTLAKSSGPAAIEWWLSTPSNVKKLLLCSKLHWGNRDPEHPSGMWGLVHDTASIYPEGFVQMTPRLDWNSILHNGEMESRRPNSSGRVYCSAAHIFPVRHLTKILCENHDIPLSSFILAFERVLSNEVVSSFYKSFSYNDAELGKLASTNMDLIVEKLSVSTTKEASRIYDLFRGSEMLSKIWDDYWRLDISDFKYKNMNVPRGRFANFLIKCPAPAKDILSSDLKLAGLFNFGDDLPPTELIDVLLSTAAPFATDLLLDSNVSPSSVFLNRALSRLKEEPVLMLSLLAKAPTAEACKFIPLLYSCMGHVSTGSFSFAHLAIMARPTVSILEALSKLPDASKLFTKVDASNRDPIQLLHDMGTKTSELAISRIRRQLLSAEMTSPISATARSKPSM